MKNTDISRIDMHMHGTNHQIRNIHYSESYLFLNKSFLMHKIVCKEEVICLIPSLSEHCNLKYNQSAINTFLRLREENIKYLYLLFYARAQKLRVDQNY